MIEMPMLTIGIMRFIKSSPFQMKIYEYNLKRENGFKLLKMNLNYKNMP